MRICFIKGPRRTRDVGDEAGAFDREALGRAVARADGTSFELGTCFRLSEDPAGGPPSRGHRSLPQSWRMAAAETGRRYHQSLPGGSNPARGGRHPAPSHGMGADADPRLSVALSVKRGVSR